MSVVVRGFITYDFDDDYLSEVYPNGATDDDLIDEARDAMIQSADWSIEWRIER